ncbi:universal stress protein [Rhodospirillum rubrum]|uniref:UspA n=1 Tax=Rhodospirillum rubrum (strain ATCC 11170 / ATH 1.1.1 / DSM 467 / LMG 4362 / NCIMB 8255 / S1) TaxID=269796 RepID=Q2RWT2_RHORT|nr:universal stress protein [Rhodospirillum rubrum]ABC21413.1 UspA [Rhodospirillum rubrum ATCC 11170]AEO47093.1 hypothetical protein F11_03115 [Rhodospirillum rubrum F11]MBK1664411.1 universal stress protein UspA [Rhodospirillum rubrum]MBK1675285.1 universal stress protein UspA [Rhodospirillum rubrum]MBK5953006.1 universal stress protein UspA [Rhodospirillum rubrum]
MYKRILVPVDLRGTFDWDHTLPHAIALAQFCSAKLHVITVVADFGSSIVGEYFPGGVEKGVAGRLLEALKARTASAVPQDVAVQNMVSEGRIYESIVRVSRQIAADLIVIGAHRPELKDFLLGPNAARVVRRASCSVLVVRE